MTKLCGQNEEILEGYKFRADRGCSGSRHGGHTGCRPTSACSILLHLQAERERCTACSGPDTPQEKKKTAQMVGEALADCTTEASLWPVRDSHAGALR